MSNSDERFHTTHDIHLRFYPLLESSALILSELAPFQMQSALLHPYCSFCRHRHLLSSDLSQGLEKGNHLLPKAAKLEFEIMIPSSQIKLIFAVCKSLISSL